MCANNEDLLAADPIMHDNWFGSDENPSISEEHKKKLRIGYLKSMKNIWDKERIPSGSRSL